jgi:predicted ATPase/DNA-binding SARP family transcriptional activator
VTALRIGLLGPLQVHSGEGVPVDVRGARLRVLLLRLALDAGQVVGQDQLVDALWPTDPPVDATAALQSLVSRLRRALAEPVISSHATGYRLDVPREHVDAWEFERAPEEHLGRWRGQPFLDAGEAGFAVAPTARLVDLRLSAVERRGGLDALSQLCAEHPLRESAHARLMLALHADGRRADALAVYERVRHALADELGIDPGVELREAHLVVLRTSRAPGRTNLPAPVSSFVGRADDLDRITRSLETSRLVTLTGFGGVGKTRLAVAAAARLVPDLPDGVWLVELDAITDPAGLGPAVLSLFGQNDLASVAGAGLGGRVSDDPAERLSGRACLLVLDNCEHLVDAVAALVERLLAAAPRLRVLATSREPLSIAGEALYPVAPLPDDPAIALFADRAAAARPGFAVDESTVDDVARVCRALDGIPLAVELAAARIRSLTPAQLAGRIDQRLRLLDKGNRVGSARHRTLRAVVDWSWDLLDGPERELLGKLSVFAGGATAEAVHRVCGGDDQWETLDLLSSLVDKSLVVVADERYRLLDTVREYAQEKLVDVDAARAAHLAHYLELAETAEPLLRTADQLTWIAVLDAEQANLDTALGHAVRTADADRAVRLFTARAWQWLVVRGRPREAGGWAAAVLDLTWDPLCLLAAHGGGAPQPIDAVRRALAELWQAEHPTALCVMALAGVEPWQGRDLAAEVDAFARRLTGSADPWLRSAGELLRGVAAFEFSAGHAEEAERHYRTSLVGFRDIGDRWALVLTNTFLSIVLANRGEFAEALAVLLRARAFAEELGEPEDILVPLTLLVQLARLRARVGDHAGAQEDLTRAQRFAEGRGDPLELARVRLAWGELAYYRGDVAEAAARYRAALALAPSDAPPQFHATLHSGLGLSETRLGNTELAGELHHRALEIVATSQDGPARASVLEGLADWHRDRGDRAGTAAALAAARAARGAVGNSDPAVVALHAWCAQAARSESGSTDSRYFSTSASEPIAPT